MKQYSINYHDYKTHHSYTVFSDWHPHAFYMNGVFYPCSGAALIMAKAEIHKNNKIINDIHDIMNVMNKFVKDFSDTSSPRFWSRWDEQLYLLLLCAMYLDNGGDNVRFSEFCKRMYHIYRAKFDNPTLSLLLISTNDTKLTESLIKGAPADWRRGDPVLCLIYPDIALTDNDASGSCLMTLRDSLTSA